MQDLQKILQKLIQFKTVTGNSKEVDKALSWIEKEIKSPFLFVEKFIFNGYPSLIIGPAKTKKPKLILAAHIDVVPASKNLFLPRIRKGKIFGRGAFDMKFAVACYLKLLKELGKEIKKYNLSVLLTSDEETGGFNGTKKILEKGYCPQVCFLPDGGKDWQLEQKSKSIWQIEVVSQGKSSHGARPWLGENAIEKLVFFLEFLKKKFPAEPCGDKLHLHNTLNVGKIEGGEAINKVPAQARAWVDMRLVNSRDRKKLLNYFGKLRKKFPGVEIKEVVFSEGNEVDIKNKFVSLFRNIAFEKYGIRMKPVISHGSSDARFFSKKKIPVVVTRLKGGGLHSENEWIDIHDLERFYQVMKEFVEKVARKE